jgi:hypothetical protein
MKYNTLIFNSSVMLPYKNGHVEEGTLALIRDTLRHRGRRRRVLPIPRSSVEWTIVLGRAGGSFFA